MLWSTFFENSFMWNSIYSQILVWLFYWKILDISYASYIFSILREKCPFSEFYWSAFSRIQTEYGKILRISLHLVLMVGKTDRKNSEYGPILHSVAYYFKTWNLEKVYPEIILTYITWNRIDWNSVLIRDIYLSWKIIALFIVLPASLIYLKYAAF